MMSGAPMTRAMPDEEAPGVIYRWYVVGVLTLAYAVSFVDRQILTLLFDPIRRTLQISDTQVSLLSGFAFAFLYSLLGIPIARLADRRRRVTIIAVGMVLWSAMTSASGIAKSFGQLFLARAGVGIGEATLSPAAYSLVADYFPPNKMARAISVYTLAIYFGMAGALLIGSFVIHLVDHIPSLDLAIVGKLYSWQLALIITGMPGLGIAALLITVREPRRRGMISDQNAQAELARPKTELVRFLRAHWQLYLAHMLGFSLAGLYGAALVTWVPELFRRTYGWPVGRTGVAFGCILLLAGAPAVLLGGWCADRQRSRGVLDAPLRLAILAIVPLAIAGVLLPLAPNAYVALLLLAVCIFCFGFPGSLAPSALQLVTPNQYRAQLSAVFLLATTLLGQGAGPTVVALISDYVFLDETQLRYSMCVVAAITLPLSAFCLAAGLRPFRQAAAILHGD